MDETENQAIPEDSYLDIQKLYLVEQFAEITEDVEIERIEQQSMAAKRRKYDEELGKDRVRYKMHSSLLEIVLREMVLSGDIAKGWRLAAKDQPPRWNTKVKKWIKQSGYVKFAVEALKNDSNVQVSAYMSKIPETLISADRKTELGAIMQGISEFVELLKSNDALIESNKDLKGKVTKLDLRITLAEDKIKELLKWKESIGEGGCWKKTARDMSSKGYRGVEIATIVGKSEASVSRALKG